MNGSVPDPNPPPMEPLQQELEARLSEVHPHGFAWAVRCCHGNRDDAEDVLHLTYVKVLEGKARFDGRSSFKTWIFGVIRRTALEQARRSWTRALGLGRWWREREHDAGRTPDPGAQASERDAYQRLKRALALLSRRQQEVLHLVFYQDLTIQQAADVLGLPVGTARTHYERGKTRLRALLARMGVTS